MSVIRSWGWKVYRVICFLVQKGDRKTDSAMYLRPPKPNDGHDANDEMTALEVNRYEHRFRWCSGDPSPDGLVFQPRGWVEAGAGPPGGPGGGPRGLVAAGGLPPGRRLGGR